MGRRVAATSETLRDSERRTQCYGRGWQFRPGCLSRCMRKTGNLWAGSGDAGYGDGSLVPRNVIGPMRLDSLQRPE